MSKTLWTVDLLNDMLISKSKTYSCLSIKSYGGRKYGNFICKCGYSWEATIGNILQGRGCKECNRITMRLWDLGSISKFINDKHPNSRCLSEEYINVDKKINWLCSCGNEFDMSFSDVEDGRWCPTCREKDRQDLCTRLYGAPFPLQSKYIRNKIKLTKINRYGTENVLSTPVVKAKALNTMLQKYGVKYSAQNAVIALKQAKSGTKSSTRIHWLTNKKLTCCASWETKVVDYLNINKINYTWQPEVFKLSTGKTYRPDLYLIDEDKWIEIKGYMRPDAKLKWDEFHTIIKPNSELWDKHKLKQLGIL